MPTVSVVMAVCNAERYLEEAVESVLAQTFRDLDLIVVNDGSTDKTGAILTRLTDPRVMVLSQPNRGLAAALNVGIERATGRYIARQDADDVSCRDRIRLQVGYLEQHQKVALVGSNYHVIDGVGRVQATTDVFTLPSDLEAAEVVSNQFGHGAVMLRAAVLASIGAYNERYSSACDVDLWNRIARNYPIANLSKPLYLWRNVGEGLSTATSGAAKTANEVGEIRRREFELLVGHPVRIIRSLGVRPLSTRGGVKHYFVMKNRMYRGLASLSAQSGRPLLALIFLILAALHAPWVRRTYRQLGVTVVSPSEIVDFPYDAI